MERNFINNEDKVLIRPTNIMQEEFSIGTLKTIMTMN